MTKQLLLQLLADNQMPDLFKELKNHQGYYSDLILLEGQWNELRSKQRNGTIPDDQANLESARIRKSLLDLIEMTFEERRTSVVPPVSRSASKPAISRWAIPAGLIFVLVVGLFSALRLADSHRNSDSNRSEMHDSPSSDGASPVVKKSQAGSIKMLDINKNPIALNKGKIGDITFKFLGAELSEQNPDNWLLRIKARVIKPAYGAHVSGSMLHIAYGNFEKGPFNINFPGVGPNETVDGVAEYEIPKEYREVKLLIYGYSDEPPLATIPIKL